MNASSTLEWIVRTLREMPDEAVEPMLVTFDALVGVSEAAIRPTAAQILRNAAEGYQEGPRRDRLLRAADDMAAGEPCARTSDGLTWKEAAAAAGMSQEIWQQRMAEMPALVSEDVREEDEETEDEDGEDSFYMEQAPPPLPSVPVRHFFPGVLVRAAQDFADPAGREVCAGDVLKLIACVPESDGYLLTFLDRTIRLSPSNGGQSAILENAGNAWFQPVPVPDMAEDLLDAIDLRLSEMEDEAEDDDDDARIETIETIRDDLDSCDAWLADPGRGPAPQCHTAAVYAELFRPDDNLTVWIPLLFAALGVLIEDW